MPQREPAGMCQAWNGGSCSYLLPMHVQTCLCLLHETHPACRRPQQSGVAMPSELTQVPLLKGLKSKCDSAKTVSLKPGNQGEHLVD